MSTACPPSSASGRRRPTREFVIGLTSFVRTVGLASTVTASSPHLVGGTSVTESHIFPYAKGILLGRPDDA